MLRMLNAFSKVNTGFLIICEYEVMRSFFYLCSAVFYFISGDVQSRVVPDEAA